jgi:hypothetical protein
VWCGNLFLQFRQREGRGSFTGFPCDLDGPFRWIERLGQGSIPVVADKEVFRRSDLVVEKVRWRLGVDGPVVQHDETFLARNLEGRRGLGESGGNESGGHAVPENDLATESGGHRREPRPLEEAAPRERIGLAAPDQRFGAPGILGVNLVESAGTG